MKKNSLRREPLVILGVGLVGLLGAALAATPRSAYAQAAASYGIAAGTSATTTTKAATSVNRATGKLAGRIADSVSKSASKSASKSSSRSPSKPRELVMEENRHTLEEQSKEGGATLHIESVPGKATVLIDGEPVARTPADLKIPAGKHIVELKEFDSLDWKEEIAVKPDENLSLKPELKKRYQSAVTVSFD
ncbi:MAG: PEGA domain-containing protein [Acidobacteria bacterium]|nr:PEGA domain-containing protein [Acidobacteriota bacterium]